MKITACLMVLNYNGQANLAEGLPSVLEAASAVGGACRVVVADNCSTEGDLAFLKANFPAVEIMVAEKNEQLFSYNSFLAKRREDVVFLLNNDMRLEKNFASEMLTHFQRETVFAVTAKTMDWEGSRTITALRRARFSRFWLYRNWDSSPSFAAYTLDFCGGATAVRREAFLKLGGFDPLFKPGYSEDTDLSYRAWKAGYEIVYEPKAVAYHRIGSTFKKIYGENTVEAMIRCNELLFILKNCGEALFLIGFLVLLPWRLLANALMGNLSFLKGFCRSLPSWPRALVERFSATAPKVAEKDFLKRVGAHVGA